MPAALRKLDAVLFAVPTGALAALAMLIAYATDPSVAWIALVALAAALLAVLRPMTALYLGIAAVPFELHSVSVGQAFSLSPSEALFILAALGWSVTRLGQGQLPVAAGSPLTKPLALLLLAVVPGLLIADDRLAVAKVLGIWIVLFLLYQMIVDDGRITTVRNILVLLAFAGAVSGVISIVSTNGGIHQKLLGQGELATGRATGEFLSPNALGLLLGMAVPGAVALGLKGPRSLRPVALGAAGVILAGLLLTLSRGALLATAGALVVMFAWPPFRRTAVLAVFVAAIAAFAFQPSFGTVPVAKSTIGRVESIPTERHGDPRWQVWKDAIEQFSDHPLFGVGANNFKSYILGSNSAAPSFNRRSAAGVPYSRFAPHAHNIGLNIAAQLGVLGLAGLLWLSVALTGVLLRSCRRGRGLGQALAFAVAAALGVVFLEGLVDYPLSVNVLAALVLVLAGCAAVLARLVDASEGSLDPALALAGATRERSAPTLERRPREASRYRAEPRPPAAALEAVSVLFVSSYAVQGGAERNLQHIVEGLGPGWVKGVVALGRGPLLERLSEAGHRAVALPTRRGLNMLVAAWGLRRILLRERPDVVHADGFRAALVAAAATALTGIPVVWLKVDYSRDGWLGRTVAARCRLVVGISQAVVSSFGPVLGRRVRVVPCGVPEYRFDREGSRALVRRLIGAPPDAPVVIHMSRLFPAKGHLELIEIIPGILERRPDARFLFAPPRIHDPHEEAYLRVLRGRVEDLEVAHAVTFRIDEPDSVRLLSGCDVAAVPSIPDPVSGWREGFGLVGAEAMAVGTPVAGYADGAIPEVMGDCALLVKTGDRDALREAILRLLRDEPLRRQLAACGRQRAQHYTVEAQAAAMRRCYREAARAG